ncbi:hypothetical protein [Rhizobium rhizogenes]|uniref:Uncharacterized protein n=1 Tax=Rhizobium rhizogenes NBRC 13257 TaxID=1220581 RepID=A0AA87PW51_RHIRH|nr:hypothetical protein [Rhizobium rhizogenes]NTG67272.1 hypothetical protein [Rhizobium rhizogenes]GAJ91035.1 hypothetical protein RRH01S_01_05060 [Rhizobium rhizogenes NBRC 13257]
MNSINEITVTFGLRWWVRAVVFVGWLIYYSIPLQSWRNAFSDWLGRHVSKRGVWVR